MSTHKHINKICCAILAFALVITMLFMNAEKLGVSKINHSFEYESRLFDTSRVHTVNIVMDDWDNFLSTCTNEEYSACSVTIDDKTYKNVAIRAKGNTSLSQVKSYGNNRYSFKIEFDHYDSTTTYYGLDKLSLNNIIQDNTYMKDYLSYQMMREAGADAPLCSYVQVLVNGEEWGLYLAVEGVEESFLQRNYGNDYGELYKPDSMSMGGGIGNGGKFSMDEWREENGQSDTENSSFKSNGATLKTYSNANKIWAMAQQDEQQTSQVADSQSSATPTVPNGESETTSQNPSGDVLQKAERPNGGGIGGGSRSNDVSLIYTDDEYDSYSNIFNNAKTDITDKDKDRLISSLKQLNENTNIEDVVDVEAVIRYFVAHNFTCNGDSYTGSMIHNYYLYEEDGKLSMLPWDYNLAFGGFQSGSNATSLVNEPIDSPVSNGTVDSRPMLAWIFESEEYTELYHKYFAEFIESYFTSGKFEAEIDAVKAMISPYVESDPTKFCTYEEFETGIDTLKQFCLLRSESIKGQLNGIIPSTSEGQSKDTSTLVDASKINISDMGSMQRGGNMGNGMMPNNSNTKTESDVGETDNNGNNPSDNSDNSFPQMPNGGGMNGNRFDMMQMPNGEQGEQSSDAFSSKENFGDFPQIPNGNQNSDIFPEMSFGEQNSNFGQLPGQQGDEENRSNIQDNQIPDSNQGSSGEAIVITVISIVVLIGGLTFALLYKRKGY